MVQRMKSIKYGNNHQFLEEHKVKNSQESVLDFIFNDPSDVNRPIRPSHTMIFERDTTSVKKY